MLRFLGCSLLAIFLCFPLSGAAQSPSDESTPTIRSTSELVVVDVVVSDGQQNPVHHLTASDFKISEDGHAQAIKVFEEHTAGAPAPMPPMPKFAPGKFTNYTPAPPNGALNILLLDKLNTPMDAQGIVRDQVLKYLKEAPAGTRIAIFALTSSQLRLLQGFTSDPGLLRALVEGKKALPGSSPLMTNSVSGDQPGADNLMMDTTADALGNSPDAATIMASMQQFEATQQSFKADLRAQYTLDAFNQLARYLSNLPGRKNLIWFSGSFPLSILPDANLQDPFGAVRSEEDEFRTTVNLLARSQVAVYPIDARGLMVDPTLSATNTGRGVLRNATAANTSMRKFSEQTSNEHSAMNQMAEATGGKAFVDNNDLKASVGKAIELGANYYTVAYAPSNRTEDGGFRRIEVKLDQPGVKLAYRRGYYADDSSAAKHHKEAVPDAKSDTTPYDSLRTAMIHGAPDPVELVFIADVRPTTGETESALAPGNQAEPQIAGPYRRYTATFVANPRNLNCAATEDGVHHCIVEFLSYLYDADGVLINMQTNGINVGFTPERFAAFLKGPLPYRQQISVPVKGEYYLRLGLRDDTADRVGALELPISSAANLPPASAPAPAPGSAPKPAAGSAPAAAPGSAPKTAPK